MWGCRQDSGWEGAGPTTTLPTLNSGEIEVQHEGGAGLGANS